MEWNGMDLLPEIVCGVCGNFHRSSQIAQKCDPEHPYYLFLYLLLIAWFDDFYIYANNYLLLTNKHS
jgi:preprotein translocase subunit SecY